MPPFFRGLLLGLSLIVAIGPQNAFVLRAGLTRQRALLSALACALCDTALIAAGVLGVGGLLARSPGLVLAGTLGGAAFLAWYGLRALRSAWVGGGPGLEAAGEAPLTARQVIGTAVGFSLLNPHALLDTVVLIGGASAGLGTGARLAFLGGTVLASWLWFFALALAGRTLAPLMARPQAWRVLDTLIGLTLLLTAAGLLLGLRGQ
ncbi:LysE/ArgO family amino acid transporter [Deinococcus multiflagellatus]|uniref:LysE/ArgO family amino acid transporter n=1 Tax=Deinococcus multiflagellatus TaxID=1656887 RepID=UPI001CCAE419|nr:LysE family transporter [Deinococcus multiflagellatus]MBZ9713395.1 LysE family transporter [Deinococcus multiflagellatus]